MKSKLGILLAAIVMAIFMAGCGDDNEGGNGESTFEYQEDSGESGATGEESTESEEPGKPPKVTGSLKKKPEIATPEGSPPEKLIKKDVKKGSGKTAKAGDMVSVQYVGLNWSNGEEFDASWGRGEPFEFQLGSGQVIQGWDEGVAGMKAGGRRLLVIPPDLGYGEAGSPPTIPANETLVFVVDLEKVK